MPLIKFKQVFLSFREHILLESVIITDFTHDSGNVKFVLQFLRGQESQLLQFVILFSIEALEPPCELVDVLWVVALSLTDFINKWSKFIFSNFTNYSLLSQIRFVTR